MDKLQACAKEFEKLLDKQYNIIIGRKGKSTNLVIEFKSIDFHHLLGLNKLIDLTISKQNREIVFSNIIKGKISYETIRKSKYIHIIENRFEPLSHIEKLIDQNNLIFRYNAKQNPGSRIKAEYLLVSPFSNNDIYIFLEKKEAPQILLYCRSFFPKELKDYTERQAAYTLLYKEKITISTAEKEVQYDRLSPIN